MSEKMQSIKMYGKLMFAQAILDGIEMSLEAGTDMVSDIAVDAFQAEMTKRFPNTGNPDSPAYKFMQSLKMQVTSRAQARIMSSAMQSQARFQKKLDDYRDGLLTEKQAHVDSVGNKATNILTGGKIKKKLDDKEKYLLDEAKSHSLVNIEGSKSATQRAQSFTTGLGSTKQAYDNANNETESIMLQNNLMMTKLINAMGYIPDKAVPT